MKPDTFLIGSKGYKAFSLTNPSSWDTNQWEAFASGSRTTGSLTVRAAYQSVAWFKRCVDIRARAVATMPFAVYRGETQVYDEQSAKPKDFDWLDLPEIGFRATQSLILAGGAYAFIESIDRKRILRLVWFDPTTMRTVIGRGGVEGFQREVNGARIPVELEDVFHAFAGDAFTEAGPGTPDADAALEHAQILHDLATFTSDQLGSGLLKTTVFSSDGARPTETARKEVENFLTRILYGRENRRQARVIGGKLNAHVLGSDLSDIADKNLAAEHREGVATALGVPHTLVASNAANYATAEKEAVGFITGVVESDAAVLASAINRQLLGRYGLEMRYEPERLEVMQKSEQEKAVGLGTLVASGILTVDEARATLGYEALFSFAPAAAPKPAMIEAPKDAGKMADVKAWRTKIERRGDVAVKFDPDHLPDDEAEIIRARLSIGYDLDDAFRPPYSDF